MLEGRATGHRSPLPNFRPARLAAPPGGPLARSPLAVRYSARQTLMGLRIAGACGYLGPLRRSRRGSRSIASLPPCECSRMGGELAFSRMPSNRAAVVKCYSTSGTLGSPSSRSAFSRPKRAPTRRRSVVPSRSWNRDNPVADEQRRKNRRIPRRVPVGSGGPLSAVRGSTAVCFRLSDSLDEALRVIQTFNDNGVDERLREARSRGERTPAQ